MRCMGKKTLVSIDQIFDPGSSLIEALHQACDLVAALDLDARPQIAGSQRFDAPLQSLEPASESSHHGTRPHGNHKGDCSEKECEHERAGATPEGKPSRHPAAQQAADLILTNPI